MECNEQTIQSAFSSMRDNGWDTESPLRWGFYFTSHEEKSLTDIFGELEEYQYEVVSLESTSGLWQLHVAKAETLTSSKLHRRNVSFNDLAEKYHADYDGWDVGQIK